MVPFLIILWLQFFQKELCSIKFKTETSGIELATVFQTKLFLSNFCLTFFKNIGNIYLPFANYFLFCRMNATQIINLFSFKNNNTDKAPNDLLYQSAIFHNFHLINHFSIHSSSVNNYSLQCLFIFFFCYFSLLKHIKTEISSSSSYSFYF